jgi:hypothetical protein
MDENEIIIHGVVTDKTDEQMIVVVQFMKDYVMLLIYNIDHILYQHVIYEQVFHELVQVHIDIIFNFEEI